MERIHQVSLQVSAHLFTDRDGGHVFTHTIVPLDVARAKGWRPILVYGITCGVTNVKSVRVAMHDAPRALLDVALEQWHQDKWMKGLPDKVVLSRHLAHAAPAFVRRLEGLGLEVEIAQGRSYEANRRAIQVGIKHLLYRDKESAVHLDRMNEVAREEYCPMEDDHRWSSLRGQALSDQFAQTPYREVPETEPAAGLDWEYGPWCELSFRSAVAPSTVEALRPLARGSRYYDVQPTADDDLELDLRYEANLLQAWPESLRSVAASIGTTEPELRAFLHGRSTLAPRSMEELADLLSIEEAEFGQTLTAAGPYLFTPKTPGAAGAAFDVASHGGDLEFAFEVVPRVVELLDRDWHLIAFRAYGHDSPSFVLVARDEPGELLPARWRQAFINLADNPFELPMDTYAGMRDAVVGALGQPDVRESILATIGLALAPTFSEMERVAAQRTHW